MRRPPVNASTRQRRIWAVSVNNGENRPFERQHRSSTEPGSLVPTGRPKRKCAQGMTRWQARGPWNISDDGAPGVGPCASNRRAVDVDRLRSHLPASARAASESERRARSHVTYSVTTPVNRCDGKGRTGSGAGETGRRQAASFSARGGEHRSGRAVYQFGLPFAILEVCRCRTRHVSNGKKKFCGLGGVVPVSDWGVV